MKLKDLFEKVVTANEVAKMAETRVQFFICVEIESCEVFDQERHTSKFYDYDTFVKWLRYDWNVYEEVEQSDLSGDKGSYFIHKECMTKIEVYADVN